MYGGDLQECVGYSTSCVTGSGDKDLPVFSVCITEKLVEACHESRSDILEGECRSMKELKYMDAVLDSDQGNFEIEHVTDHRLEI